MRGDDGWGMVMEKSEHRISYIYIMSCGYAAIGCAKPSKY